MSDPARLTVEINEWKSCDRSDLKLTEEDRRLANSAELLSGPRLTVEELRSGVRFTARSWVGVVRFSTFDVHIRPKLIGGNLRLLELIEFTSGLEALKRCPAVRTVATESASLPDIFIFMFIEECERILRGGLLSDYVEEENDLPALRGRPLWDRQFRQRFGRLDRVCCRYDERKQDVWENQLLAFVLELCARRASQPLLQRKARQLEHLLLGVCDPAGLDLNAARGECYYDRMNEQYRAAHELCRIILDAFGIADIYSAGSARVFAFLLDMNRLFEAFVHRLLQKLVVASPCEVVYQHSERSIIRYVDSHQSYARVIPDFLVSTGDRRGKLPLDAKYKLYDSFKVSNADIYQSFLYAFAFSGERLGGAIAGLIYPSDGTAGNCVELSVRSGFAAANARLALIALPIGAALTEARSGDWGPATDPLRTVIDEFMSKPSEVLRQS